MKMLPQHGELNAQLFTAMTTHNDYFCTKDLTINERAVYNIPRLYHKTRMSSSRNCNEGQGDHWTKGFYTQIENRIFLNNS
jgi:hypothetical protein